MAVFTVLATAIGLIDPILAAGSEARHLDCGDRQRNVSCAYPERVYLHNGGHVIDVTQPPFNATGDGTTDDTAALIRAYDYVLDQADRAGWSGGGPKAEDDYIIYLPNGTYLVSDTIVYSGPPRVGRQPNRWEQVARVRFIGESRLGSRIQLRHRCPRFTNNKARPVLSFGKSEFNNHKALTVVRNLTIDTGIGNPRAVGLDFMGANLAEVRSVTIRSGDGAGDTGLLLRIAPTVGIHRDITIEGFNYGLRLSLRSRATHPVFEHLTVRDQAEAGIRLDHGASISIRKLLSDNAVPALEIDSPAAHAILIDSRLTGRGNGPAIQLRQGQLFARNVETPGYGIPIRRATKAATPGHRIDEYVSSLAAAPSPSQQTTSLNLPIEDIPQVPWPSDPSQWICPEDQGAQANGQTDDTAAVQAAMDSGKPVIYFPGRRYHTQGVIRVPATVRRVNGLFHSLRMTFETIPGSEDTVIFEDFSHATVRMNSRRPVMISLADWAHTTNTSGLSGVSLHLCGAHGPSRRSTTNGLNIWARSINSEGRSLPFYCSGAQMWVFGFKSERAPLVWEITNNARLEILGGTFGVAHDDTYLLNKGCAVSMTANSSGFGINGDEKIVVEVTDDAQHVLRARELPQRPEAGNNIFIPLHISKPK